MRYAPILCALTLSAQELPDPATYQPANAAEAVRLEKAWLHSGVARLVAWGAYLAGSQSRREMIPDLLEVMDFVEGPYSASDPRGGWTEPDKVLDFVLDALIHLDAQVSIDRIRKAGRAFNPERTILLARMPGNTDALLEILDQSTWDDSADWAVVADLLAVHPPPGFAARVWDRLQPSLTVYVRDEQTAPQPRTGGGRSCGDWGPGVRDRAWPVVPHYALSIRGGVLLAPGVYPGSYVRWDEDRGGPYLSCIPDRELPEIPRAIAATLAERKPADFPLRPNQTTEVSYRDSGQYASALRTVLDAANNGVDQIFSFYIQRSLLTAAEADAHKLPVRVVDDRGAARRAPLSKPPTFRWLRFD